ncbi:MAG: sensor domain-containing diguanylate cyclase [Synergistaceae bacterium]|nr:sensor domain-containing diguanylate cyclase [Synergistaceae bacterium]
MENLSECVGVITAAVDEAPVGFVVIAPNDRILLINKAAEQLFEFDRTREPDMTWAKMRLRKDMRSHDRRPLTEELEPLYIALRERRRNNTSVLIKSLDSDFEEWVSVTAFPVISANGLVIASVAVMQDISDYVDMQEIMHEQAIHDPLTGLSNRTLFSGNLSMAIARARRAGGGGAVLVIDLDRFKQVNVVHGYIAGDDLLAKVGRRLFAEVRGTDTVSRIGEDEFAVLLADIGNDSLMKIVPEITKRICDSIGVVYRVMGREVSVTGSIGATYYPQDGNDEKTLISNAATAMYYVKTHGRNGWKFFHELDEEFR